MEPEELERYSASAGEWGRERATGPGRVRGAEERGGGGGGGGEERIGGECEMCGRERGGSG
jgi:hypothetical protein